MWSGCFNSIGEKTTVGTSVTSGIIFFTNQISNVHFKYVLRSIIKYSSIKEKYAKRISKKEVRQAGKPGFGRRTYMIHKDAMVCLYFERVFYVADLSG